MTRDDIRIRIMQEALDCADRGETEAYNSIKVMCSDVLQMVERLVEAERKFVCLTDEEFNDCLVAGDPCENLAEPEAWAVMKEVEAKLKEKNHK